MLSCGCIAQRPEARLTRGREQKGATIRKDTKILFMRLDPTSPRRMFVRPKVNESGRLYRSNLKEDVPLVLRLTNFFWGAKS
jgi:hypothetical protein